MPDVSVLSPNTNECIMTAHVKAQVRAAELTGVVSGNDVAPSSGMQISVALGRIRVAGAPVDVGAATPTISASDATYPRVDIIVRKVDGTIAVDAGTPAEIVDPNGLEAWKSYTSPAPANSVTAGVILAAVYVGAGVTEITANDIWDIAVRVPDALTTVGDPGVDSNSPTDKAVRTAIGSAVSGKINTSDIVTEVDDPGSDSKVPSEQAVREALDAVSGGSVTNGDSHDHSGGDGAQIDHGGLGGLGDDDHSIYYNQTRGDARYAQLSHASRHQSGGADSIKIDDLVAGDDNEDLDASTAKHGLMPKFPNTKTWLRGDKTWQKNSWGVDFEFGDGSAVISAQSKHTRAGQKACKIVKVYIRSTDGASPPALLSGSATVKLYIHDLNAEEGTAVETISLSSVSNYTSSTLSHAVAAGKWVTVEVSGITNYKCLVVSLEFEAT